MWTPTLLRDAALLAEYIYNHTFNLGDAALLSPIDNDYVVKEAHRIMDQRYRKQEDLKR